MIKEGIILILRMLVEIYKVIPFGDQVTEADLQHRAKVITDVQLWILNHYPLTEGDQ